jgi:hypothetical protein
MKNTILPEHTALTSASDTRQSLARKHSGNSLSSVTTLGEKVSVNCISTSTSLPNSFCWALGNKSRRDGAKWRWWSLCRVYSLTLGKEATFASVCWPDSRQKATFASACWPDTRQRKLQWDSTTIYVSRVTSWHSAKGASVSPLPVSLSSALGDTRQRELLCRVPGLLHSAN